MQAYKADVVGTNTKGIEFLFKKNKIDWIKGWARSRPRPGQGRRRPPMTAKNIVIATGSEASSLKGVTVDNEEGGVVVTSTGALACRPPKSMVVIGAGVIGLEMGSVYARLGAEVTVVEFLDAITPGMDAEVAKAASSASCQAGPEIRPRRRRPGVTGKPARPSPTSCARTTARPARGRDRARRHRPQTLHRAWASKLGVEMGPRGFVKTDAISRPTSPASTPSATRSPARCSPTRPRMRAWRWPKSSPASMAM
jgi:dihydrolipoamide dehydrogenase